MIYEPLFESSLSMVISVVLSCAVILLPVLIYLKRQNEKVKYSVPKVDEGIDHAELEKAEAAVKDVDLLQELHKKYTHLQSFASINGHDRSTMTTLIVYLKEKGIDADFYFSQSYMVGFGSMTSGMGEYFLFVDPEKADEALRVLDSYFGKS